MQTYIYANTAEKAYFILDIFIFFLFYKHQKNLTECNIY